MKELTMNNSIPLKTRRKKARYGDRTIVAGIPVVVVKSGGKQDFLTAEEFVEDLYGKKVKEIVFE